MQYIPESCIMKYAVYIEDTIYNTYPSFSLSLSLTHTRTDMFPFHEGVFLIEPQLQDTYILVCT